jgi:hypothetical protein
MGTGQAGDGRRSNRPRGLIMQKKMKMTFVSFRNLAGERVAPTRQFSGHPARGPIVTRAERDIPGCVDVEFRYGTLVEDAKWEWRSVRCGI